MRSFLGSNARKLMQWAAKWVALPIAQPLPCCRHNGRSSRRDQKLPWRKYSCHFQNKSKIVNDSEGSYSRFISLVGDAYLGLMALGSAEICTWTSQLSIFLEVSRSLFNCTKVDESIGCDPVSKAIRPHVPHTNLFGKFEPQSVDPIQAILESSTEKGSQFPRLKITEIFAKPCTWIGNHTCSVRIVEFCCASCCFHCRILHSVSLMDLWSSFWHVSKQLPIKLYKLYGVNLLEQDPWLACTSPQVDHTTTMHSFALVNTR